jgi:2,5-diketo-D-gluconate reductase B
MPAEARFVESHGCRIPTIGLGTMTLKDDVCVQAVKDAIGVGYKHIDTAAFYGNEREVGEGLKASKAKREDLFVVTKVRQTELEPAAFAKSVEASLKALDLPWVDLLLIHWPNPAVPQSDSIKALCAAKRSGQAKNIGVANFTTALLDEAMKLTTEPLVTNQIEVHPFIDQSKVIDACKKHGITVTAYCPIARGKVPGSDVLERIAKAHGKSPAQVSLRYLVQLGIAAIPRTATPAHMAENLDVFGFTLSEADMAELTKLNANNMRVVNPPHAPKWDA